MILVIGTVRAPAKALEALAPEIEKMLLATRKEDGCIRYAFAQDLLDPTIMHVSEAWRDLDALRAHGNTPHMAEWRKSVGGAGMYDRDIRFYDTDEGTPL